MSLRTIGLYHIYRVIDYKAMVEYTYHKIWHLKTVFGYLDTSGLTGSCLRVGFLNGTLCIDIQQCDTLMTGSHIVATLKIKSNRSSLLDNLKNKIAPLYIFLYSDHLCIYFLYSDRSPLSSEVNELALWCKISKNHNY